MKLVKVSRSGSEEVQKIANTVNEPHTHNYEELLIGMEGVLEHFIDFETTTTDAPYVSFVSKGKIHRVRPQIKDGKCDIWVICFQSELITATIFQLYTLFHHQANISFPTSRHFKCLVHFVN